MAIAKIYNSGTGTWDPVLVGQTGAAGIVTSATAPSDTTILWMDTTSSSTQLAVPSGGSTGQILQKNSNTDYDTVWTDVSRSAGKNLLLNGAFEIAQRGTSFGNASSSMPYTLDRWSHIRSAWATGSSSSRVAITPSDVNGASQYALRLQRNSGDTGTGTIWTQYCMPVEESARLAGQTLTFSAYVRLGSNFSGTSVNFAIETGTAQGSPGSGITGYIPLPGLSITTATTTWKRFSVTFTVPIGQTFTSISVTYVPSGTAGANDYFDITGAQLEFGSVATPFSRAGGTLQGELAACQRYFQRYTMNSGTSYVDLLLGYQWTTTAASVTVPMPVEMRATPSVSFGGSLAFSDRISYNATVTSLSVAYANVEKKAILLDIGWSGAAGAQFRPGFLRSQGSPAWFDLSAEV